ncbi:MAG: hypothetical protein WCJ92_05930 [Alphaproteobacteria bacterium]
MTNLRIVKHVFLSLLLTSGAVYSATFDEQPNAHLEQTTASTVRGINYPIAPIESLLDGRLAEVGQLFPPTHIRNALGNEIKTEFDKALAMYKKSTTTEEANSILINLGEFCINQELKLYKLHYSRVYTDQGKRVYEYDRNSLRQIDDFTMSESEDDLDLPSINLLTTLSIIDRRLDSRRFVEGLATASADAIFSNIQNHALIHNGAVTKPDITALINRLREFRS